MNAKRLFTFVIILNLVLSLLPGAYPGRAVSTATAAPAPESEGFAEDAGTGQTVRLPAGVSEDWWAQTQEYIQQSEYEISWQEPTYLPDLPAAYQASNRAQGLRIYFTSQGIRLISRAETTPTWQLGVSLVGYGAQANLLAVSEAVLSPAANRMDYQRAGPSEWYINDEGGLQQGFVLPGGAGERTDNASEAAPTT